MTRQPKTPKTTLKTGVNTTRKSRSSKTAKALLLGCCLVVGLGFGLFSLGCAASDSAASTGPAADKATDSGKNDSTKNKDGKDVAKDEAVPVAALPLFRGPIEAVLRYTTHLEAESAVEVYAEASRQITELAVEEGRRVSRGDVLVRLRDQEQKSALAKIESQLAKAIRDYDRQARLYDQQLISDQVFSEATYQKEQLGLALEDARRELSYTVVRAPISGVITQRLVGLGDTVQVNQHLFDIVDFGSLVARIYIPERELPRLSRGQTARIVAAAVDDGPREARVERIAPTVDQKTGTVKVTLTVNDLSGMRPGLFAEVELVAAAYDDALLVPKRSLVYDDEQVFVYRVRDGQTVEKLLVKPEIEDRFFVSVGKGLAVGDQLVLAGQAGLRDGMKVRVLGFEEALAMFGSDLPDDLKVAARAALGG